MTHKKHIKLAVISIIVIVPILLYTSFWFFNASKIKNELTHNNLMSNVKVSGFPLAYHIVAKDMKFSQLQFENNILNDFSIEHLEGVYDVFSSRYITDLSKPIIFHDNAKKTTFVINFSKDSTLITKRDADEGLISDYQGSGYTMTMKNDQTQKYVVYQVKNPMISVGFAKNKLAFKSSDAGYEMLSDQGDILLSAKQVKLDVQADLNDQGDISTRFNMAANGYVRGEKSHYIFDVLGDSKMQLVAKMQDDNKKTNQESDLVLVGKLDLQKNPEGTMKNLLPEDKMQQIKPEMRQYYQRKAPAFNINLALDQFKYSNSSYSIALNGELVMDLRDVFPLANMTVKIVSFEQFVDDMKKQFSALNAQNNQINPKQEEKEQKIIEYVKDLAAKNSASADNAPAFNLLRNKDSNFTFQINHTDFSQIIDDIKQLEAQNQSNVAQ